MVFLHAINFTEVADAMVQSAFRRQASFDSSITGSVTGTLGRSRAATMGHDSSIRFRARSSTIASRQPEIIVSNFCRFLYHARYAAFFLYMHIASDGLRVLSSS